MTEIPDADLPVNTHRKKRTKIIVIFDLSDKIDRL